MGVGHSLSEACYKAPLDMIMWNTTALRKKCHHCISGSCFLHCTGLSYLDIVRLSNSCDTETRSPIDEVSDTNGDTLAIADCELVWYGKTNPNIVPKEYNYKKWAEMLCLRAIDVARTGVIVADVKVLFVHIMAIDVRSNLDKFYLEMLHEAASAGHPHASYILSENIAPVITVDGRFDARERDRYAQIAAKNEHMWAMAVVANKMVLGLTYIPLRIDRLRDAEKVQILDKAKTLTERSIDLGYVKAHFIMSMIVDGKAVNINHIRDQREGHKRRLLARKSYISKYCRDII